MLRKIRNLTILAILVLWIGGLTPVAASGPTSCEINLVNNTHTCGGLSWITMVTGPSGGRVVAKISGKMDINFEITYGNTPTNWTVNIGDSQSNDGGGGDAANQSNDAETQILGTTLTVYGKDGTPVQPLLNLSNFVSAGSTAYLKVKNQYLGWGSDFASFMNSNYLYALNGQPDTEGPVNYDIYAAFNRTIYNSGRNGSGVTWVRITVSVNGIPPYSPAYWNDGGTIQYNNNCYNYGNNKRTDTFAQPGRAGGGMWTQLTCSNVYAAAVRDGLTAPSGGACSYSLDKLALVVWPGYDYHWYRQDSNGMWSHKPGGTQATNLDNSGNTIPNPETANRGPYTDFCGYLCSPSDVGQGQGNANIW